MPKGKVKVLEEYLNTKDWQKYPLTGSKLHDLAIRLVEWSKNDPKALKLAQFASMNDIEYATLLTWANRYDVMKTAFSIAKSNIGARRETESKSLLILPELIIKSMHVYDPAWDEINKYHADLKSKDNQVATGNIKLVPVYIPEVPNSDLVPERTNKEEE